MRSFQKYLALATLLILTAPLALRAQSDSQTLHSPYASLVGIADLDIGFATGGGRSYPISLGGSFIAGFQVNRILTVGLGVGLHGYGPSDMTLLPLFADARLHFPQRKWTPYIAVDAGYALSLTPGTEGGLLVQPSLGGRFPLSELAAVGVSVGYRYQENQGPVDGQLDYYLPNYLSAKVGVVVKFPRLSRRAFAKTINHRMRDKNGKKQK